jgi:hypothetical protein
LDKSDSRGANSEPLLFIAHKWLYSIQYYSKFSNEGTKEGKLRYRLLQRNKMKGKHKGSKAQNLNQTFFTRQNRAKQIK